MLKRHPSSVESLPHHVVELILERLAVKSLLRFKSVSKTWKSTMESRCFQEKQFITRSKQAEGPDGLVIYLSYYRDNGLHTDPQRIVLGSSTVCTVKFPFEVNTFCYGSCDGLVCIYSLYHGPVIVLNPATKWHRRLPLSSYHKLLVERCNRGKFDDSFSSLGFGREKSKGQYKPVWLYNNSSGENVTTCEVFDFSTNAWRYVVPASPYQVIGLYKPVYLDGLLYWLTKCEEPQVLSFDLRTETFQVICKAPFAHSTPHNSFDLWKFSHNRLVNHCNVAICTLDNHLCVSEKSWPNQVIWSLDSSGGRKTWKKMCVIDLTKTYSWLGKPVYALTPIAILDKDKLMLQGDDSLKPLVIHDLNTKSYDLLFQPTKLVGPVYYLESLLSVLAD